MTRGQSYLAGAAVLFVGIPAALMVAATPAIWPLVGAIAFGGAVAGGLAGAHAIDLRRKNDPLAKAERGVAHLEEMLQENPNSSFAAERLPAAQARLTELRIIKDSFSPLGTQKTYSNRAAPLPNASPAAPDAPGLG